MKSSKDDSYDALYLPVPEGSDWRDNFPLLPSEKFSPSTDPEESEEDASPSVALPKRSIQSSHIIKTYVILAAQLIITFGSIAVITLTRMISEASPTLLFWTFMVALGISGVSVTLLSCLSNDQRKFVPILKLATLAVLTIAESFALGTISLQFTHSDVLFAVAVATVVFIADTTFSFLTRWELTFFNKATSVAVACLYVFGIVTLFLRANFPVLNIVYPSVGAFLFSFCLIHDTTILVGGQRKKSVSPGIYICDALCIYLDIVIIYLFLNRWIETFNVVLYIIARYGANK